METKIKVLTECLNSNAEEAYELYLYYLKATGKEQEVYRVNYVGINSLFDNPADAVMEFVRHGIMDLDYWRFMYLNSASDLHFTDEIGEKVDMTELAKWILNLTDVYDRYEICELLDRMDFQYYYVREMNPTSTWNMGVNSEWLEENELIDSATLLKEDWVALNERFQAYLVERREKYNKENPHLIKS